MFRIRGFDCSSRVTSYSIKMYDHIEDDTTLGKIFFLLGPTKFDLLKLLQKNVIQLQMTRDDQR